MSGLNSLRNIFQKKGTQYVADLMNSYVVVNEKLEGSYFAVMLDQNNEFKYFKKGAEISYTDRVLNKFYNKAIEHFENISEDEKLEIPSFYLFAMQYFPQDGRLILSHIHELSADGACTRTTQTKHVLDSWANTLHVMPPAILFEGRLSDEQKSALLQLLDQPIEEFENVPFERALLTILGVTEDREINTVVFRFYDDEKRNEERSVVAKLASPAIESLLREKQPESVTKIKSDDFVWLILVDLINFVETFTLPELQELNMHSQNQHVRYVQLINELYKKYMEGEGAKWEGLELNTPNYLKGDNFDLNTDLISDTKVKELVNTSSINKEIYKIMLNMFRNPNVRVSSKIFTEGMKNNLRMQIEKLSAVTMNKKVNETYFPTFVEFLGKSTSYSMFEEDAEPVKKNFSVNVIVDYFQPINKSHVKVAQKLQEKNNNKAVLVAVSQVNDRTKYPLGQDETYSMLESVMVSNPELIQAVHVVPNWNLETILESLGHDQHASLFACTSKRVMDYAKHIEYYQRKNSPLAESTRDVTLVEVDHNDFGDRVRETLIEQNFEEFKNLTPEPIHGIFESLTSKYLGDDSTQDIGKTDMELQEHVKFLRMVISDDSNVTLESRSSIVNDLNVVQKKFKSKDVVSELKDELLTRGISESDVDAFVADALTESEITQTDLSNLTSLVKNGIGMLTENLSLTYLDVVFEQYGINKILLDKILSYKLKGHDGAGIGEFATSILFKYAKKLQENGDVSINNKKIEVKNNDSQLLSIKSVDGDIAFNEYHSVLDTRMNGLTISVANHAKDDLETILEMINSRFEEKSNFNINQKGIRNYTSLFRDLTGMMPTLPVEDLYEWFMTIFVGGIFKSSGYVPIETMETIKEHMQSVFESKSDVKSMLSLLTYVAFRYYAKTDGFSGMMMYRTNNESMKYTCLYLPESVDFDTFNEFVEPVSGPSLVDARTSKSFKIRMRQIDR